MSGMEGTLDFEGLWTDLVDMTLDGNAEIIHELVERLDMSAVNDVLAQGEACAGQLVYMFRHAALQNAAVEGEGDSVETLMMQAAVMTLAVVMKPLAAAGAHLPDTPTGRASAHSIAIAAAVMASAMSPVGQVLGGRDIESLPVVPYEPTNRG